MTEMMKIRFNEISADLSAEELTELEAAQAKAPTFDEGSPEMTAQQLMQFHRMDEDLVRRKCM